MSRTLCAHDHRAVGKADIDRQTMASIGCMTEVD
jgi:hypothetical protein